MSNLKYDSGYDAFEKLCKERNVTPYKVSKETGIGRSTLSDWKNGKSVPKIEKLAKIAEYFGVPVSVFERSVVGIIKKEDIENIVTVSRSELDKIIEAYKRSSAERQSIIKKILEVDDDDSLLPVAAHAHEDASPEELASDVDMLKKAAEKKRGN